MVLFAHGYRTFMGNGLLAVLALLHQLSLGAVRVTRRAHRHRTVIDEELARLDFLLDDAVLAAAASCRDLADRLAALEEFELTSDGAAEWAADLARRLERASSR